MSCRRGEKESDNYNEINEILEGTATIRKTDIQPVFIKSLQEFGHNFNNTKFEYFKTLVKPGNVKRRELELFLNELNVCDKEVDFSLYKMHMRQTIYSHDDLYAIMNAVRHASFKNQRFVQETFKEQVTKEEKRAGHKALTNISNFWLIFTNAMERPQELRGS